MNKPEITNKVFIPISVEEELPPIADMNGTTMFADFKCSKEVIVKVKEHSNLTTAFYCHAVNNWMNNLEVEWWLKEVELPTEEEIAKKAIITDNVKSFIQGALYILNLLKAK